MSIHILPPEVVDQIAAGEVVERPSHLVKEIVENSLDAGATSVHIEYALGGRYVKVTDNGKGMTADDLPKALQRFATSKIAQTEDLWKLKTFGFRGEALASISAVSYLTLTSRQKGAEKAYQLVSDFGKKQNIDPVGGSEGTTVLIEKLFENTPARLKFLKSDAAEHSAIKTTLKAMALSHPHAEFRIQENGKLISYWPACKTMKDRVEQVLEVTPMFEGQAQRENVRAYAVFADPHNVAKTSKNIWLFAQNRWIQDRSMQAAVMEAYRSLLMHGEFPIAAVWVDTDPDFIDVNIHPTKSQVKFQNPSLAFRAVQASLRDALELAPWIDKKAMHAMPSYQKPVVPDMPAMPVNNIAFADPQLERAQFAKKNFFNPEIEFNNQSVIESLCDSAGQRQSFEVKRVEIVPVDREGQPIELNKNHLSEAENISAPTAVGSYWSSLQVLGQANQTYIVCQARDRIVFVDQHAAHERVAFERLMSAWRGGKIDIQEFLFPLAIDMSPEKVEALMTLEKDISKLGVHIEMMGPGTIGVKAAPLIVKESILSNVIDKMAGECLEQGGSYSLEKAVGDICATIACHSVVRAGQVLSLEQMQNLLQEMDQFPLSSFCPHGRPVSVDYLFYKLEKDFGRIV